ncbi:sugar porter family MFS transporter [Lacipirellula parvula]|uniref:Putative sugar:proton symporter n=1 Tax=Lacipirellula parvula TaxID=2650471 RepID=A0A5K7XK95_9BACT|nr:sugar porter family MFS transporter [Lacipirellula parvula]BBO33329.1 putative sugar:proton symporter [Lacipirellula parvula]
MPSLNVEPSIRHDVLWRICLIAAMGGLLFGYDWVVIGGAKPFYELYFGIADNPFQQGLAMSSALVGCLAGAVACGALTDRFGRRPLLMLSAFLFTASAVWTGLATTLLSFNLARIAGGIGIGLASTVSPMYISEISPARSRGRLVSINQMTVVIGILAAQIVNWAIARDVPAEISADALLQSWYGQAGWRWMFGAGAVPAMAFLGLAFILPESPRWLARAGRNSEAEVVLATISGAIEARTEMAAIRHSLNQGELEHFDWRHLLERKASRALMLGIGLVILQQWCGINVIFNYAEEIFRAAGYDVSGVMRSIVITGSVNLAFTLVALATVDAIGRRTLMLVGAAGLALINVALGTAYYTDQAGMVMVGLVIAAIAIYAMTLASVTWVVIAELYPTRIRGVAMSLTVFCLWAACGALTFTFPFLNRSLGAHGVFWLYGAMCAIGFAAIWNWLVETKGIPLEAIDV